MDLVKMLLSSMTSESSLSALTGKTGGDAGQVESAIQSAIPSLIGSMTKNASSTDGAKSLLGALSQHQDTNSISSQIENADEIDGGKIIGKIMGGGKDDFISSIASKSGLNFGQTNSLLSSIAPAILSFISSAAKPDTAESQAEEAARRQEEAQKNDVSFLGGFFSKFLKDEDDKVEETKEDDGFDGGDLLNILKNTLL